MKLRTKILGLYILVQTIVLGVALWAGFILLGDRRDSSALFFDLVVLASGLIAVLVSTLLVERVITRRLQLLSQKIKRIGDYRSFYDELQFDGNDEVASLATTINQMLRHIVGSTNQVSTLNVKLEQEKAGVERVVEERTRQLGIEKARLKSSVVNLSLGFIMTDVHDNVLMINERAQVLLSPEPPAGSTADDTASLARPRTIAELGQLFAPPVKLTTLLAQSLSSSKVIELPELISHNRILRVLISPILDSPEGTRLGGVILLDDVTEQKLIQRSKDEFFSIASHELRTPLTAIRGNAYMLKSVFSPRLQEAMFDEMVDDIHDSSRRLIDIVNDFLDVSRLEQGKAKFTYTAVSLDEIANSVVSEVANLAQDKTDQIILDASLATVPRVRADKDRVKQVFYNLIGNSLKFTKSGTITVSAQLEADAVKVLVVDTGEGISPTGQKLLFHKFQQAGSSLYTRETSRGTGLGLYISQLLVQTMGGAIQLERSEVGKGSTFSFSLPVIDQPAR